MTAVISPRDREAVITTADMPTPADAKVYQLWVISAAGARSAGLLPGSGAGVTSPVLATGVRPGDRLAITVEPAGGTSQPTTTRSCSWPRTTSEASLPYRRACRAEWDAWQVRAVQPRYRSSTSAR